MVTEDERNTALAELLASEVEATGARSRRDSRSRGSGSMGRPGGFGPAVVTGAVALAVIAVSASVISLQPNARQAPAATSPAVQRSAPAPGTVLATFTSSDGRTQTKSIAADGSAVQISYDCRGSGSISITVPGGSSVDKGRCDGATTLADPTTIHGTVPVTVTADANSSWTVRIEAIATHGQGVTLPGPDPTKSD